MQIYNFFNNPHNSPGKTYFHKQALAPLKNYGIFCLVLKLILSLYRY